MTKNETRKMVKLNKSLRKYLMDNEQLEYEKGEILKRLQSAVDNLESLSVQLREEDYSRFNIIETVACVRGGLSTTLRQFGNEEVL